VTEPLASEVTAAEALAAEIDVAEVVGRFAGLLHDAGMPVTPTTAGRFASSISLAHPERVEHLYWLARVTLLHDRAHVDSFNRVFDSVFRGVFDPNDVSRNPNAPAVSRKASNGKPPTSKPSESATGGGGAAPREGMPGAGSSGPEGDEGEAILAAASNEERMRAQPFGTCTEEELQHLTQLIGEMKLDPPLRMGRRTRQHTSGREVDLRATLRAAQRTGGDPVKPLRRKRQTRPRRVVLIADVSGSMESYGRAYLYLLHGAVRAVNAEAFVFATQLHRLTRTLTGSHPEQALRKAMSQAPDWSGGTRIGEALKAFNDLHARRGIGRGAIIVIVSDGWEGGDVSLLGQEMERLSRLAYRIVWVNPRKQRVDYEPLVGGMAAALPWVDQFVSGHSVNALTEVIHLIAVA
jgi:uncharacterized protein